MGLLLIVDLIGKVAAIFVARVAPETMLVLWFGPDLLLAYHIFVPWAQGLVRLHRRFATTGPDVWLTIDDGPDPEDTPQLLELLAAHGASATFFVIGEKVARHPGLIRAITAAGHEVAHHTHTHPLAWFWCALPAQVRRELDLGLAALHEAGVTPTRFRPPAGIKNLWLAAALRERGLTGIGWSARGRECRCRQPEDVAVRVLRGLRPGAILLVHESPSVPVAIRVQAIRLVLERLAAQGFRCVIPARSQLR